MISTDIAIIGAGPVGLFAVFECGLLKMRCHLVDFLPQAGGQLKEIYPKKPIYDIPGYPYILAQDLIDKLLIQIEPFSPGFTFGQRVEVLEKKGERDFILTTSEGIELHAKAVVIAGGLGCFEPRKPEVSGIATFENGKGVSYMILEPEKYRDKEVVLAGGGDSALDWAIQLYPIVKKLTLVHRSESFKAAPDSVSKVLELSRQNKIGLLLNSTLNRLSGNETLENVEVLNLKDNQKTILSANALIPLFGLSPKLGPIANWGLSLEKNAIEVSNEDYVTNVPGIYAIGDINTYKDKLKLILCGFHEAAMMSHSAFKYINPNVNYTMKYTTVNGIQTF